MYGNDGIPWFPPGLADEFYILKGLLALVATVALVAHMVLTWDRTSGSGQRLRYFSLLYFAVLITAASVEQSHQDAVVNYRNLGAIGGVLLLLLTLYVSLREYARTRRL